MPSSVERFLTELAESGLVSQDTIRFVIDGAVGQTGSGEELAARLVQEGRLTQYQADSLLMGNGRTLVLGNYTILDAIGAGGMGVVLKAEHRRMKRKVALKILPQSATDSDESVKRFCREVQAAAKLNHPNIITTYDADEAKGVHFYIMEYVDGCDLARLVEERGPLPVGVAVSCILQSARGLAYAHSEGIVHRDIKPSNLMLDYSGTVQILDMGLARLQDCDTEGSSDLTGAGVILGTIDYMSPEQALDTQHADHRADVYSLGATLHYLITGQAMLAGKTRGQKMQTLLSTSQTQTATLLCRRDDVPTELEEIFQRMTARSLESRYQSMDEVVTALTQFASDHASVSSAQAFDFKAVATRTPTAQAGLSSSALERLIEDRSVATTLVQPHGVEFSEQTAPDLPGVTSGISPRVPSTVLGQYQTRRFPWTLLVASSLFLAAFAGGTALLLQARAGTLHITIPDGLAGPVTVDLDGESKKIRGRDDNVVTVDVAAGTHDRLRVMAGGTRLLTDADEGFELDAGDEKRIVARLASPIDGGNRRLNAFSETSPQTISSNFALQFDGIDDFVELPFIELPAEMSVTLETWVTPAEPPQETSAEADRIGLVFGWQNLEDLAIVKQQRGLGALLATKLGAENHVKIESLSQQVNSVGRRQHVALTLARGTHASLFVDGIHVDSIVLSRVTADRRTRPLIGGVPLGAQVVRGFSGRIEGIRLSQVVRYDEDFVPVPRFEADEDTLALYHCDEDSGDLLKDASGSGRHGKIKNAVWVRRDDATNVSNSPGVTENNSVKDTSR